MSINGETLEERITGWANWAVVGNDAIYEHQVPFVLKELHTRIKQALRQAIAEELKRGRIGEDHPYAKLTEAKVLEAKQLVKEGWTYTQLGERYGVTPQAVYLAVKGKNWAHLTER